MHFSAFKTPGGYAMGEVRSALQKEIRRGNELEALFWLSEIDLAGYGAYAFPHASLDYLRGRRARMGRGVA
jgi:hypothetical protein